MSDPNTGGLDPRTASSGGDFEAGEATADPAERSFDPAGEREPGVPGGEEEGGTASGRGAARGEAWRKHAGRSAGEAAERSVDVGGSPGAVPNDLRRDPGR